MYRMPFSNLSIFDYASSVDMTHARIEETSNLSIFDYASSWIIRGGALADTVQIPLRIHPTSISSI